ncbi:MAG: c-type cytochrome [Polyangiaceae bacterium]
MALERVAVGIVLGGLLTLGACADQRPSQATPSFETIVDVTLPSHLPVMGGRAHGSPIQLVSVEGRRLLVLADGDAKALRVLDGDDHRALGEVMLEGEPTELVAAGDGRLYVALRDRDVVVGVELDGLAPFHAGVRRRFTVPTEPIGLAVTPDGRRLVVTSGWAASLVGIELASGEEILRQRLPREPRSVAVSADGREAFVSHALGSTVSRVPLDGDVIRAIELGGVDHHDRGAEVAILDFVSEGVLSGSFDGGVSGGIVSSGGAGRGPVDFRGGDLPSFVERLDRDAAQGFALALGEGELFVPEVLVHRGRAQVGGYGTSPSFPAHQPALARIDLVEGRATLRVMMRAFDAGEARNGFAGGARRDGCLLPRAAAVDARSGTVLVACVGSDEVMAISSDGEALATSTRHRWKVPPGPMGLAIDETRREVVVWSRFAGAAGALSRLPLEEGEEGEEGGEGGEGGEGEPAARYPEEAEVVGASVELLPLAEGGLSAAAQEGRRIFHGASDARISADGRACASCHPDGRDDGLSWPTPNGARQTPMLAGRLLESTRPFGWQGDAKDLPTHLRQTFRRLGGRGLDDDAMASLLAYLGEMGTPSRPAPPPDPDLVARGRRLFHAETVGCATCHTAEGIGSDGARHDVGTGVAVETPSLRLVAGTGPYFHDGRFATLSQLLRETRGKMGWASDMGPDDLSALEAYLLTL